MTYVVENVTALYPKIDKPYRFDNAENRSVPCSPLEDGAAYELSFKIAKSDAVEFWGFIDSAWKEYLKANKKDVKTKMANLPYKQDENDPDYLIFKAKLKAAYGAQTTKKPTVFNAANQAITDEEFQLTTGSTVNVAVQAVPYMTGMANGVSLRLRAVQLIELAEVAGGASPFKVDEDAVKRAHENMKVYEQKAATSISSVDDTQMQPAETMVLSDDDLNDEIPF